MAHIALFVNDGMVSTGKGETIMPTKERSTLGSTLDAMRERPHLFARNKAKRKTTKGGELQDFPTATVEIRYPPQQHLVVRMDEIEHPMYSIILCPSSEDPSDPQNHLHGIFIQVRDQRFPITPGQTVIWPIEITVDQHKVYYAKS